MTAAIKPVRQRFIRQAINNDIGVPMTLLRLTPEYDYAVIELGANHQGEIAWTVSLTRPEAALVNNLAAAHLEGFGSLRVSRKRKVKSLAACRKTVSPL